MAEVKDDPRDVLALLNSLGFVGITAPQLKAFMKDLKMHRKIKEREHQQWKENTTKKILSKQECMLDELLRETIACEQSNSLETRHVSLDSSQQNDPLVRIRVHCVSEEGENEDIENGTRHNIQESVTKRHVDVKTERLCRKQNRQEIDSPLLVGSSSTRDRKERSKSNDRSKLRQVSTDRSRSVSVDKANGGTKKVLRKQATTRAGDPTRPLSAPIFTADEVIIPEGRCKSVASDPTGIINPRNAPSRCSTRSQPKSFIRPWQLQPEAQRSASAKKSDPVALYQKYQQEWKRISFPGEEQHARLRWAIREKMLGTDPNPRPILKKSQSLMSIKKR